MARRDPTVFERTAKGYSRVRPGYPAALFDWVVERTEIQPAARLLELGCGPGLATEGFASRGFRIHAIDAARAMLHEAQTRIGDNNRVSFEQALFEEWSGPDQPVDMVFAGMAWHWLDPDVRDDRVAAWLVPHGWLAVLVNWPVRHWADGDDLYAAHWPSYTPYVRRTIEERVANVRSDFARDGHFEFIDLRRWPRTLRHTADEYVQVLDTYSDHVVLPNHIKRAFYADVRQRVIDQGGTLTREIESVAMLARVR